jgi:hypothetical protein
MQLPRWFGILFVFALTVLPARAQVQLEWKLKEGDAFFLQTESKFVQVLELAGKEAGKDIKQEIQQTTLLQFKVEKKDEKTGVLTVRQTVEGLMVKGGTGASVADDKLQGATFTFTLSPPPKMTVDNFQGYAEFIKKASGDDPAVTKAMKAILSEDLLKVSAKEAFSFLPEKPVKEGDTWGGDRSIKVPIGPLGTMDVVNTYKYAGKDKVAGKDYDKITFTTAVTYTAPKPNEDSGLTFKVTKGELKTEGAKGTIYFDRDAGRMVQYEAEWKTTGQFTLSINNIPLETKITKQEQTIKATVSSENPITSKPK